MKKKTLIIIVSVVLVCALGLVLSLVFNWPVSSDSTSGNIGKSSRFSRKTTAERIDNMEELLKADEDYKNGIVLAYSIMQTRAMQFAALVDMSNQVADEIPEFEGVLKDMNEATPMVQNVVESLAAAGADLNTILQGESCSDVTQNTINASLAYTVLQKQNELANRFIETTDKYIKKADASDELLFVRDQWVDYQQMTAALEGDTKAAKVLKKKGTLLPSEKAVSALNSFDTPYQVVILSSADLSSNFDVNNSLVSALPSEVIDQIGYIVVRATEEVDMAVRNVETPALGAYLIPIEAFEIFRSYLTDELANLSNGTLGARPSQFDPNGIAPSLGAQYDPRRFYNFETLEAAQLHMGVNNDVMMAKNLIVTAVIPGLNYGGVVARLGDVIEETSLGLKMGPSIPR